MDGGAGLFAYRASAIRADEAATTGRSSRDVRRGFLLGGFSDGAASRTGDAEISLASRAGGASAIMLGDASASATAAGVRG